MLEFVIFAAYFTASIGLFAYGLNSYVMLWLFSRVREKVQGQAPHPWRHQRHGNGRPWMRKISISQVRRKDVAPRRVHHGQGRLSRRSHRRRPP